MKLNFTSLQDQLPNIEVAAATNDDDDCDDDDFSCHCVHVCANVVPFTGTARTVLVLGRLHQRFINV
jgi:hypothetical protein